MCVSLVCLFHVQEPRPTSSWGELWSDCSVSFSLPSTQASEVVGGPLGRTGLTPCFQSPCNSPCFSPFPPASLLLFHNTRQSSMIHNVQICTKRQDRGFSGFELRMHAPIPLTKFPVLEFGGKTQSTISQ